MAKISLLCAYLHTCMGLLLSPAPSLYSCKGRLPHAKPSCKLTAVSYDRLGEYEYAIFRLSIIVKTHYKISCKK